MSADDCATQIAGISLETKQNTFGEAMEYHKNFASGSAISTQWLNDHKETQTQRHDLLLQVSRKPTEQKNKTKQNMYVNICYLL